MVFKKKFFDIVILSITILIAIVVFIISSNLTNEKIEFVKQEKYNIYSKNLNDEIALLMKNKQELTLSVALALASNSTIIKALKEKDTTLLNLKEFSQELKEKTRLKNAWFHIVDAQGTSFYRTWVKKRGDSLLKARMDIVKMIKEPKFMCTISTGKFDMTFKSMVPIFDKGEFLGVFEIITHFNSISKQLLERGVESVILVDKKYKKQITKPLTKLFLDDYYIANLDAKQTNLDYIKKYGIEQFMHSLDSYRVDEKNDKFIVMYNIPDIHGNPMGTVVAFKPLSSLNMDDIATIKQNMAFYIVVTVLVIVIIGYYIISTKHSRELDNKVIQRTKELQQEKQYIQTILDTNPNIIIVTNSFKIIDANKRFLEFFHYDSVDDFVKDQDCICDFFITLDEEAFCNDKMVNGIPWAEYIAKNKKEHIVQLKFNSHIFVFTVNAEYLKSNGDILLTFQNITEIKRKDRLLFEQSKLASMGEMIGNIAHQWRQPLSVVSSCATGMKIQKEFNTLSDEQFNQNCDLINENIQYLSKTIDDFRNFIKGDTQKSDFTLNEEFQKMLNLIGPSIKSNNIEFELDIKEDIKLHGFGGELLQCLLNIYNNAKDSLLEVAEDSRVFTIHVEKKDNSVEILLQDSGVGIKDDIIDKLFEPYFTTKHQKQGTGLGLHMTYNMIVHGMQGSIEATNSKFTHKQKEYKGALFTITLPM